VEKENSDFRWDFRNTCRGKTLVLRARTCMHLRDAWPARIIGGADALSRAEAEPVMEQLAWDRSNCPADHQALAVRPVKLSPCPGLGRTGRFNTTYIHTQRWIIKLQHAWIYIIKRMDMRGAVPNSAVRGTNLLSKKRFILFLPRTCRSPHGFSLERNGPIGCSVPTGRCVARAGSGRGYIRQASAAGRQGNVGGA
jgi:hypothetical protein